jgi:hypothetical protein
MNHICGWGFERKKKRERNINMNSEFFVSHLKLKGKIEI